MEEKFQDPSERSSTLPESRLGPNRTLLLRPIPQSYEGRVQGGHKGDIHRNMECLTGIVTLSGLFEVEPMCYSFKLWRLSSQVWVQLVCICSGHSLWHRNNYGSEIYLGNI